MGVYIKRYKYKGTNGYRPYFYGKYECRGVHDVKLCKICGTPPASLSIKDEGDAAYERSKQRAIDMLQEQIETAHGKHDKISLYRQAIRVMSGEDVMEVKISDLDRLNAERKRRRFRKITQHEQETQSLMATQFMEFAKAHGKTYFWEINQEFADEYFDSICSTYSVNSIAKRIYFLSGAFKRFAPTGYANPFQVIGESLADAKREYPQTPHRPLTPSQIIKLIKFSVSDPLLYPLTMCMLYTGLRLGDASTLLFSDILWKEKVILRKMNKTRTIATIPIFDKLQPILEEALDSREKDQIYVFPKIAEMYSPHNPKLVYLGKKLIAQALFGEEKRTESIIKKPTLSPVEMLSLVENSKFSMTKKERLNDIYSRYMAGQSYRHIEQQAGYSRGQISEDLHTLEQISDTQIRPVHSNLKWDELLDKTREVGTSGKNKRCIYGWHSLRSTYIVSALIFYKRPIEEVRKNCGHTDVSMTLRYFNPTYEHVSLLGQDNPLITLKDWYSMDHDDRTANKSPSAEELLTLLPDNVKADLKKLL